MTQAQLGFMLPLFDLAASLVDSDDVDNMAMGLGYIDPKSPLARDDRDLDGLWVSGVANTSIAACLDHVVTLRDLVLRTNATITTAAPWTLLRAAVEACSVSVWVMEPRLRRSRRARALRVWHYDYMERHKWENDAGVPRPPSGKTGRDRAAEVEALATALDIKATQVVTPLAYSTTVAAGAAAVGWNRTEAVARWREASAFAHGRFWPQLALTSPTHAEAIPGGYSVSMTLSETHLEPLARLAHDLLTGALLRWAALSAAAAD